MSLLALGLDFVFVLGVVLICANANRLLGPRPERTPDGELPFETGEVPFESAALRMCVLYWRFAVLFVVFDVDLAFLLPWALNRDSLTRQTLGAVTVFTVLVGMMLAYFWRKGTLECEP